jgi:periplasmic protein TonB
MSATLTANEQLSLELPWGATPEEDRRFKRILRWTLILALLLGLIMPWLPMLQHEPEEIEEEPRRVASFMLEPHEAEQPVASAELAPAAPEEPAAAAPQQAEEPQRAPQVAQPEPRPEQAPAPAQPRQPSARERAEQSGVLALRDRLADLQANAPADSLRRGEQSREGADASERERRLTASNASSGSGGIDTSQISRETGAGELAGRAPGRVASPVGMEGGTRGGRSRDHRGTRTDEEIQLVFDRDKSSIYALYNRALREDPTLRGQVVLRLTIAPSGEVTQARVVSSELNDQELERRLLLRVRQLDFGAKEVDTVSINYPIDFFPS